MKKILLVEDNVFLSDLYKDVLESNNFTVHASQTGKDAMEQAKKGGWDLILMDVFLPDMNGFDIAKELKEHKPTPPNKSLVFFTNVDKPEEIESAKKLGDGFIMKSEITPGDLVERLKQYLDK